MHHKEAHDKIIDDRLARNATWPELFDLGELGFAMVWPLDHGTMIHYVEPKNVRKYVGTSPLSPSLDQKVQELARRVEAPETYDDPAERRFRQYCKDHRLTFEIVREFGNWVLQVQGLYVSHPDMSYCFSWALHQLREASA